MRIALLAALILVSTAPALADSVKPLTLVATGITSGAMIPKQYTGDGNDLSPPLAWSPVPTNTKSIAIFVEDPDAPSGTWCHWIAYNLSPKTRSIGGGIPRSDTIPGGAKQATNDFDKIGYNGPAPPRGKLHRYYFHVYALSRQLNLPAAAKQADFRAAIKGAVLAEGILMATYKR